MGCTFGKQEDFNELDLSPTSQRRYLLRFATQSSRYVKYAGCPELAPDETSRLLSSSKNYFQFLDSSGDIHLFTDFCSKYPRILNAYFKNVQQDAGQQRSSTVDADEATKIDLARHISLATTVIRNAIDQLTSDGGEASEEALRRLGATHAEFWVCSKDVLLFEDSFMWTLDKSDPDMDQKLKYLWRRVIKFILHNIAMGINSHYEKLSFVLGQDKSRCNVFQTKLPNGVNPKSYESLKKLNAYMKAQQ
ncbi:hypothetical protein BsWGS_04707 [Bradybaena similaris]